MHAVFVDSNVLYSRTLRDWLGLIYLEEPQPYAVFWTEDVVAEFLYHLRRDHPTWGGRRISSIRDHFCGTFENGRVADFDTTTLVLPDPDDVHVHSAAVACDADILLTANVKDFPGDLPYDVMTADEFFVLVDDSAPMAVHGATKRQAAYWGRKPGGADLPRGLTAAGCPRFADRVLDHLRNQALVGD